MKMTFRWYGEGRDPISLKKIKQIPGMSGLMGVLDEKAAGEVWTYEECKAIIEAQGEKAQNAKGTHRKSTRKTQA